MTTTKKTTTKKTTVKTVKAKASTTPIPNLPNIPFAFEVLDAASKQRSKAKHAKGIYVRRSRICGMKRKGATMICTISSQL